MCQTDLNPFRGNLSSNLFIGSLLTVLVLGTARETEVTAAVPVLTLAVVVAPVVIGHCPSVIAVGAPFSAPLNPAPGAVEKPVRHPLRIRRLVRLRCLLLNGSCHGEVREAKEVEYGGGLRNNDKLPTEQESSFQQNAYLHIPESIVV